MGYTIAICMFIHTYFPISLRIPYHVPTRQSTFTHAPSNLPANPHLRYTGYTGLRSMMIYLLYDRFSDWTLYQKDAQSQAGEDGA